MPRLELETMEEVVAYAQKHGCSIRKLENVGMGELDESDGYDEFPDIVQHLVASQTIQLIWL